MTLFLSCFCSTLVGFAPKNRVSDQIEDTSGARLSMTCDRWFRVGWAVQAARRHWHFWRRARARYNDIDKSPLRRRHGRNAQTGTLRASRLTGCSRSTADNAMWRLTLTFPIAVGSDGIDGLPASRAQAGRLGTVPHAPSCSGLLDSKV